MIIHPIFVKAFHSKILQWIKRLPTKYMDQLYRNIETENAFFYAFSQERIFISIKDAEQKFIFGRLLRTNTDGTIQSKTKPTKKGDDIFRTTSISRLQLIKQKASIIRGHLYGDALIRQLWFRTAEREEQAISMSFPWQEGSFQMRPIRITGWGRRTRAPFIHRDWNNPCWQRTRRKSGISSQNLKGGY